MLVGLIDHLKKTGQMKRNNVYYTDLCGIMTDADDHVRNYCRFYHYGRSEMLNLDDANVAVNVIDVGRGAKS